MAETVVPKVLHQTGGLDPLVFKVELLGVVRPRAPSRGPHGRCGALCRDAWRLRAWRSNVPGRRFCPATPGSGGVGDAGGVVARRQ